MLTAVSYNIHQCVGTDGRRDPQRVAAVIQDTEADIIGLQEVDFNPRGEKKSHQLDYLAKATGMRAIAGPTLRRADSEFGNALLTRREISEVRLHDVSVFGRQPRGVIDAEIACDGRRVRVLVTHLGLAVNERRRQAQSLVKIIREQRETYDLTLVLGDINEWRPRGFALYSLNSHLGKAPSPRTFPSFFPVFALDRIWVKPKGALLQIAISSNGLARTASDHLPVLAKVKFSTHPASGPALEIASRTES
ncbi:MAG TPA: endonuclease/exonuclease/phosphatase family protein [Candidatus Binatia bacterium]|nr:endonuclease/exonuclease/phosphatase family protein [Candidatus Binatia bacterium]